VFEQPTELAAWLQEGAQELVNRVRPAQGLEAEREPRQAEARAVVRL